MSLNSVFKNKAALGTILNYLDVVSPIPGSYTKNLLKAANIPEEFAKEAQKEVRRGNPDKIEIVSPFLNFKVLKTLSEDEIKHYKKDLKKLRNSDLLYRLVGEDVVDDVYDQIILGRTFTQEQIDFFETFFPNDSLYLDWKDMYQGIQKL
jgi:hypothetical protein